MVTVICLFFPAVISLFIYDSLLKKSLSKRKLLFFFCTGKRPSPVANLLTHLVYDSKTQLSTITLAISHNYLGEILCLIISFAHNAWAGAWHAWKTEVNFLLPQCIVTTIFYYMFSAPL